MVIDFEEKLTKDKDIRLIKTDRFRAENLLKKNFEDNPAIGLDIASMVQIGLDMEKIENSILQYFGRFSVYPKNLELKKTRQGTVSFCLDFQDTAYV